MKPVPFSRRFTGVVSQLLHPSYSTCLRCGMSWAIVHGHTTYCTVGGGCFPLCEDCWSELTPEDRLSFYRKLWDSWWQWGKPDMEWDIIKEAVLAGK